MLAHPFGWLPEARQKQAFWALLVPTLLFMTALLSIGTPLKTAAAPGGMMAYEFAGTAASAQRMVGSWDHRAQLCAALGLGLDYLFLVLYACSIALGCALVAQRLSGRRFLTAAGAFLAWGQFAAALLDAVENYALIRILLYGVESEVWPATAFCCAALKFALVVPGILYVLLGALWATCAGNRRTAQ